MQLPHSNLASFALLRNLRLLAGMRRETAAPRVFLAGIGAPQLAAHLARLEPTLRIEVGAASSSSNSSSPAEHLASLAGQSGKRLDAIILTQLYHSLASADQFRLVRAALDEKEGMLGMTWYRALLGENASAVGASRAAVAAAAAAAARPASSAAAAPVDVCAALAPGESPMGWVEAMQVARFGFKPVKHRKVVDRVLTATPAERAALLQFTSDERAPAAAVEDAAAGGPFTAEVKFDVHLFHTTALALKNGEPAAAAGAQ